MTELTAGTITFVYSDIEGSTTLLRRLRDGYAPVLAQHQQLLREAVSAHGGREVDAHGDSFFASFRRPREAVLAAVAAQRSLGAHSWPDDVELRVRIGVHTGPADVADGRYVGLSVHRAARICAAGHGGQVLVSHATVALLEDDEDELAGIELRDLGEHELKDFGRAVRIYGVIASGIAGETQPLRTGGRALAVRASDADRERTAAALREHTVAGRLTLEEFSERVERATASATLDELQELERDLPVASPAERPQRRPKRLTGVVFGDVERTGRWRLARRSFSLVVFGNLDLDLRQAELEGTVASVTAFVLFGNVDLYVPEGVEVDLGGLAIFGHRHEWGRDVVPQPGTPLLRVKIFSLFGTADVWRVPVAWARRTLRQVIRGLSKGEQRELPPAGY